MRKKEITQIQTMFEKYGASSITLDEEEQFHLDSHEKDIVTTIFLEEIEIEDSEGELSNISFELLSKNDLAEIHLILENRVVDFEKTIDRCAD